MHHIAPEDTHSAKCLLTHFYNIFMSSIALPSFHALVCMFTCKLTPPLWLCKQLSLLSNTLSLKCTPITFAKAGSNKIYSRLFYRIMQAKKSCTITYLDLYYNAPDESLYHTLIWKQLVAKKRHISIFHCPSSLWKWLLYQPWLVRIPQLAFRFAGHSLMYSKLLFERFCLVQLLWAAAFVVIFPPSAKQNADAFPCGGVHNLLTTFFPPLTSSHKRHGYFAVGWYPFSNIYQWGSQAEWGKGRIALALSIYKTRKNQLSYSRSLFTWFIREEVV